MAANWTAFVAGNVLTAAQLNGVVDNFQDIAIFNETQSSGTAGGASTSTYTKRTLNTTVVNNITGCSIASSVITLPAGTYHIVARAPARNSNGHKIRLANTTDSTYVYGTSAQTFTTGNVDTDSDLNTVITIAASKNFEIQHKVTATAASFGFGSACSFGDDEKFSEIFIRRIA